MGLQFLTYADGYITGLQFYKGLANTGTHSGELWGPDGTRLATATFSDESLSGWQQVDFSPAVAIDPGITYTASYFGASGYYAADAGYFDGAYAQPTLMAAPAGSNGVEQFSPTGGFPQAVDNATNFWVQPVFYPSSSSGNTLDAPTGLRATPLSDGTIRLDWMNDPQGATAVTVLGSGNNSQFSSRVPAGQSYCIVTGLQAGTPYTFQVVATSPVVSSDPSSPASATTLPVPAPASLSATAASESAIQLTWTDNSSGQTSFTVERSPDGTTGWTAAGLSLAPGTTSFRDRGLANGTTYYYRVSASDAAGTSTYSNVDWATTNAIPAPSGLAATAVSDTEVELTWADGSSGRTGFTVERSPNGTSGWTTIGPSIAPGVSSFHDTGLSQTTLYYYRVAATDAAGTSAFSNLAWAQTPYSTPTIASAAAAAQTTVTGTTDTLSVLGAILGGQETSLSYTWAVISGPGGATFIPNGSNAAKNATITFAAPGTYTLQATVQNGPQSVSSSVQVTVNRTLTSIVLTPAAPAPITPGGTQQFFAAALDQFGAPVDPAPTLTWSVISGEGSVDATGLFAAGPDLGQSTVQAAAGAATAQATVMNNEGVYKVTLGGSRAIDDVITGGLTVSNTGWIAAASPADAIRQAITGTVTITDKENAGVSGTATFPDDLGGNFQIGSLSWNAANAQYTGQIELTFPFEGYEEYFTDVTVDAPAVTGTLGIVESDNSTELPHDQNLTPGGYVKLNDDNDNYQFTTATGTTAVPDNSPTKTNIAGEKDLVALNIHPVNTPTPRGYYALTSGSKNITLWENSKKFVPVTGQSQYPEAGNVQVFVEGAGLSAGAAQEQIALWFIPAPGLPPIRVDTAAYTVYSIEGPSNVIGLSKFTYTATVPGGANSPEWSGNGATILPNATDTSARVLWESGPDVAKVYYSPAPGFRGEFDANVVNLTITQESNTPPPGQAVRTPGNPNGTVSPPDKILWTNGVELSAPVVNGVARGVRFLQIGYVQAVFATAYNATYSDGTSLTETNLEGKDFGNTSPVCNAACRLHLRKS